MVYLASHAEFLLELNFFQRSELHNLQQHGSYPDAGLDIDMEDPDILSANDFLAGHVPMDLSHAGGEFEAVFDGLDEELLGTKSKRVS